MDDTRFDEAIRGAFRYGVGGRQPKDLWPQIAEALQRAPRADHPQRRFRAAVVAGSLVAAAVLLALLLPAVRAIAADGLRALWNVLWEGEVGGRPARVVTLPGTGTEATSPGPAERAATGTRASVRDLAEAAALAGFEPPSVSHDVAVMREVKVVVVPVESAGEVRVVETSYKWNGRFYTLTAVAAFLADEEGRLGPTPVSFPDLLIYTPPGEVTEGAEVVDLGGAEAVCSQRTVSGHTIAQCDWLMGDVRVSLNGPDLPAVVELARTAVKR